MQLQSKSRFTAALPSRVGVVVDDVVSFNPPYLYKKEDLGFDPQNPPAALPGATGLW